MRMSISLPSRHLASDNDTLLLSDLPHTYLTCCDLLQQQRQLPHQPDFVDHMWFPGEHCDVARCPVLHPAGHRGAADRAVCHPGYQRLPGMHLRWLPRKQRRKEQATVKLQSHRTIFEIGYTGCTHWLEPSSWLGLWKRAKFMMKCCFDFVFWYCRCRTESLFSWSRSFAFWRVDIITFQLSKQLFSIFLEMLLS